MILLAGWGRLGRHLSYLIRPYHPHFLIWHPSQNRLTQVRGLSSKAADAPFDLSTTEPASHLLEVESEGSNSLSSSVAQKNTYIAYGIEVERCWGNVDTWTSLFNTIKKENLKIEAILLSLPDRLLQESIDFLKKLCEYHGPVVHFSGAFYHPQAYDLHPLASFGYELLPDSLYPSIYWVSSHPPPLSVRSQVFPFISQARQITILPEQKALYHALCVLAGPGAQVLWQLVVREFEKMGLPSQILIPYLHTLMPQLPDGPAQESPAHSAAKNPSVSLKVTGPWVRQDQSTIDLHLTKLPPSLQELYRLLMTLSCQNMLPTQKESL